VVVLRPCVIVWMNMVLCPIAHKTDTLTTGPEITSVDGLTIAEDVTVALPINRQGRYFLENKFQHTQR